MLLIELFLIPGVSIAGVGALACLGYANYYAFANMGTVAGFITLAISLTTCVLSLVWFMRSRTLEKVALKENITSQVNKHAERSLKPGDTGIAITRLALIGQAEINGKVVEVKSIDGFLDERTPIVVERVADATVMVKRG